jgi:hypothetical protein
MFFLDDNSLSAKGELAAPKVLLIRQRFHARQLLAF